MTPLVTLVIPSFNPGKFLEQTLQSVNAQTLQNYECIVVDDGSNDTSIKYFQKAAKTNPRLRLIRHKVTSGVSAARNSGIRSAYGKFISFLDADDLLMPRSLELRVKACQVALKNSRQYAGSYCASTTIAESFKGIPSETPVSLSPVGFAQNGPACPFNANQPMIRADILRAAGGFNERMHQSEDYDLWLRILRAGFWFAPAHFATVTYRKRTNSQVRKAPLDHLNAALKLLNGGEQYLTKQELMWSPYRLSKPFGQYASQRRKTKRIMEFCGMNLASKSPSTPEEIAELLKREVPDFRKTFAPNHSFLKDILSGVRRQTGGVANDILTHQAKLALEHATPTTQETQRDTESDYTTSISKGTAEQLCPLWNSTKQAIYDFVFIPHKDYHVWTIALLREELNRRKIPFIVVDITAQWREAGVRSMAQEHGLPLVGLSEFVLGRFSPSQIIVFNDWDPVTRPIVAAAKSSGITTTAIVEGIQDYEDADVHWKRQAYQLSDTILLPGEFDQRYFNKHDSDHPGGAQKTVTVGVARVQALRNQPPKLAFDQNATPRVLINSNFSYDVLIEHRDEWLTQAVKTTLAAGMEPVISRHPADKGHLFERYVTKMDFYSCLESCQITIQRFASGVLEAIARETPVFYFNPHGERVDKFTADPMGAYCVVNKKNELLKQLTKWRDWEDAVKKHGPAFLDAHTGDASQDIYAATIDGLMAGNGKKADGKAINKFKEIMLGIDRTSGSLTQAVQHKVALIPELEVFNDRIAAYQSLARTQPNDSLQIGEGKIGNTRIISHENELKLLVKELSGLLK